MCNKFIVYIGVMLLCICLVKTENYDDRSDYNASRSADSESNEVDEWNFSSKTKPMTLKSPELKSKSDGNMINSSMLNVSQKCKRILSSFPYSVSIQKKSSHYASGALIHKQWILTVAGDFYNIRETIKLFRARLGSVNCKKGGVLVAIKRIEAHPSYVYKEPNYDVALLRIGQHTECSEYVTPISLSNGKELIVSAKFVSTYWPRLIVNGKILAQSAREQLNLYHMRASTQKMIPWDECYNFLQKHKYTLDVSSYCLEPIMSHHSPCMPDVGAPIISEDGLWGITSSWISDDCLKHPSPTLFTRISLEPVRSWLDIFMDEDD